MSDNEDVWNEKIADKAEAEVRASQLACLPRAEQFRLLMGGITPETIGGGFDVVVRFLRQQAA